MDLEGAITIPRGTCTCKQLVAVFILKKYRKLL